MATSGDFTLAIDTVNALAEAQKRSEGRVTVTSRDNFRHCRSRLPLYVAEASNDLKRMNEFVFRFNRHRSRRLGMLFYRVLETGRRSPPGPLPRPGGRPPAEESLPPAAQLRRPSTEPGPAQSRPTMEDDLTCDGPVN